jgi:hypothetical protein
MHVLRKIAFGVFIALIFLFLLPFILLAALVTLLGGPVYYMLAWYRARQFCRRHDGDVYLICSRRRGWEPFLRNNLFPVTKDVVVIWKDDAECSRKTWSVLKWMLANSPPKIPFVVFVGRKQVFVESLNGPLQAWKRQGKRSVDASEAGGRVLQDTLLRLRRRAAGT